MVYFVIIQTLPPDSRKKCLSEVEWTDVDSFTRIVEVWNTVQVEIQSESSSVFLRVLPYLYKLDRITKKLVESGDLSENGKTLAAKILHLELKNSQIVGMGTSFSHPG